jgi:hypothetical protein
MNITILGGIRTQKAWWIERFAAAGSAHFVFLSPHSTSALIAFPYRSMRQLY